MVSRIHLLLIIVIVGSVLLVMAPTSQATATATATATTNASTKVTTTQQQQQQQPSSPHGPIWSWKTFPAFFHGSNVNNFTEEDLEFLTRFPIITLEKWQGPQSNTINEEKAWVEAATKIKAVNPEIAVIVWLDSLRIYTADKNLNPDLKQPCTTGNFGPSEWLETGGKMDGKLDPNSIYLLKNSSGLPAIENWSGCHIFDHTQKVARRYWTEMCLNLTKTGVIDGCGADASWQNGIQQAKKWGLSPVIAQGWSEGHKKMMRETTALLGEGILLGKEAYEVGDYVNGALCENCPANNATINLLRDLTAKSKRLGKRLLYECHSRATRGDINEVAAFLIGVGEYQYYGFGGWDDGIADAETPHWMDGVFGRELGPPHGDGSYNAANGVWTRSFDSGTTVTFDTTTNKGKITWASTSTSGFEESS